MHSEIDIARALAAAFVAGPIERDGLVDRGAALFGRRWRWLAPLAERICGAFQTGPRPRRIEVIKFLRNDRGFLRACERYEGQIALVDRLAAVAEMCPLAAAISWDVPAIRTAGELAEWLGISLGQLDWFADRRGLEAKQNDRLRHYHYRPLAKQFGQVRLIEAPKPRLKEIQRRILVEILDRVPAHSAAHGFRRGRSVKTFAAPHVGKQVVLRVDLQDFFPTIAAARVQSLFRALGYPDDVADILTGLCCNTTPRDVWDEFDGGPAEGLREARYLYWRVHLPQGAPTSPALANLCAYRLDCRLAGLALAAGAMYTRYADDLAFSGSGKFCRSVKRFHVHVCATAMEEGFRVNYRKTRIMHGGVRQRLAGVVVNTRLNVSRSEYDKLKATLTNCVRGGVEGQNREAHDDFRGHLLGRISYVAMLNSRRGENLKGLFRRIAW